MGTGNSPPVKMAAMQYARCISEVLLLSACSLLMLVVLLPAVPGAIPFAHPNSTKGYFSTVDTAPEGDYCMWAVVWVWSCAWLAYSWTFVCRPKQTRTVHELTYFMFACYLVSTLVWFYFRRQERASITLGFSFLSLLSLYLCLLLLFVRLYTHATFLSEHQRVDLWMTRVVVLNGLAFAAAWAEVLLVQDVTRALKYQGELDDTTSALAGLSLLAALILLYFAFEQTFLDRYVRHSVAQYLVYPWALTWMLVEQTRLLNGTVSETIMAYTISLLLVAVLVALARVVLNSIYACVRPITYPEQEVAYHRL